MSKGAFITFEGTEGGGKTTQIQLLHERLKTAGWPVRMLREPGGTPVGEEIRFTLKHSPHNGAMTAEAELLLMNASRAQLVREVICPALSQGEIVLCDRFYDSTIAYQGYGRELDLAAVKSIIEFAVGQTHPDLTLWLDISPDVSEARRRSRHAQQPSSTAPSSTDAAALLRDRIEEAGAEFFKRVHQGFMKLPARNPIESKRSTQRSPCPKWQKQSGGKSPIFLEQRHP